MPKIMLINVTHAEESRVGIVTDGVLSSFEIESFSREHLKGNIEKRDEIIRFRSLETRRRRLEPEEV